jgi:hypothetical protein
MNGTSTPSWIYFYSLFIIVILPSITKVFFNCIIFYSVHSSTRRIHALPPTTSATANINHRNSRDTHLLKHMLFLHFVFISGWGPVYIFSVIDVNGQVALWFYLLLQILPVISSLINIIDLFLYNHELRRYLTNRFLKCLHLN